MTLEQARPISNDMRPFEAQFDIEDNYSMDALHELDVENGYPMELTPSRVRILTALARASDSGDVWSRARAIVELNNDTYRQRVRAGELKSI